MVCYRERLASWAPPARRLARLPYTLPQAPGGSHTTSSSGSGGGCGCNGTRAQEEAAAQGVISAFGQMVGGLDGPGVSREDLAAAFSLPLGEAQVRKAGCVGACCMSARCMAASARVLLTLWVLLAASRFLFWGPLLCPVEPACVRAMAGRA